MQGLQMVGDRTFRGKPNTTIILEDNITVSQKVKGAETVNSGDFPLVSLFS